MSQLPDRIVRRVRARARYRCEYCRSRERYVGQEFTIDHVIPRSRDGTDDLENLCLACSQCNHHKQAQTSAVDPRTGKRSRLFPPRNDKWMDHFRWGTDGTRLIGITPVGRATIKALQLNRRSRVRARKFWAQCGVHP
jgi:hypothetical protein